MPVTATDRFSRGKSVLPAAMALFFMLAPLQVKAFRAGDRHVNLNGQSLDVTWDSLTMAPQNITAVGSDLLEIKNIAGLTKSEINEIGALLVGKYGSLLKVPPEHLVLKKAEKTDGIWRVSYQQRVRGMAVYDSSLVFSIDTDGHIKSLDAMLYPNARAPGSVKIHRGQAIKAAQSSLPATERKEYRLFAENMAIFPERNAGSVEYRQVFVINMFPRKNGKSSSSGGCAVIVDAQTGKVVRIQALQKSQGCSLP
ncbi:MAG: hypothetical protein HY896_14165 [Deltaproteobacteria bacterium]|nr:hypothetical protein [Deltaproteobacteria bacterium]